MAISLYTISAICGNFKVESTVNPGTYESLHYLTPSELVDNSIYGGYGLGQWTNKQEWGLTRRTQLIQWLRDNGYSDDDGNGQLSYLLYENYWHQNVGEYATLTDFLNNESTNISELTRIWMRNWEGINSDTLSDRQSWANRFYNYISEHYLDQDINTWITGNRYLSEMEMKNNAVLVARFLWDNPTPPPYPTPEHITLLMIAGKKHKKRKKKLLTKRFI